ncbi:Ribonuclease E [hydrothermal vent metagenome]|uniref:Ribonuclease E n=1 Tax=hydrothermal vent metagenome TaxID=652676 RepID=A0A3B0U9L8_9ZZZZ
MATKRMLVDASHPEETRIVVTSGNRLDEFDYEAANKRQLRGNIYLAKVTRVEPSLQAAFVEYGGNRHGFLAFSEIHPDYFQIPVADREALLADVAHSVSQKSDQDEDEPEKAGTDVSAAAAAPDADASGDASQFGAGDQPLITEIENGSEADLEKTPDDAASSHQEEETDNNHNGDEEDDGLVAAPDVDVDDDGHDDNDDENEAENEELIERRRSLARRYKIQEVIKRRQVLLVQVVKEERGNKGAALTTYLSLAGRYSVLMPNTARGGGISRKITSSADRKRLKQIAGELSVPAGMGVILRTAGAARTKAEIKRDFEYLSRLWENVRQLTMKSTAPSLVYEEGSLIKRTIRDLYHKDIAEVLVAGNQTYREAKDFMRLIMPSHAKNVKAYKEDQNLFSRFNIESQLDLMFSPKVVLPSGGYLVINPTEALISIDVNSGRATKEHNIEDTALQTNLEAADEVARQLRLRDLAGLIVIDFIDMTERRSTRAVEKRMKDALKNDRARIQIGRISHFGLLEMSRQRMRFGVLESTTQACPACEGTGIVRAVQSLALMVVRAIEDHVVKRPGNSIQVRAPHEVAFYILNSKRALLVELEQRYNLTINITADAKLANSQFTIERGQDRVVHDKTALPAIGVSSPISDDDEVVETVPAESESKPQRNRRRRKSTNTQNNNQPVQASESEAQRETQREAQDAPENGETSPEAQSEEQPRKRRRRGRRGGRRNRRSPNAENQNLENQDTQNQDTQNLENQDTNGKNIGNEPDDATPEQPSNQTPSYGENQSEQGAEPSAAAPEMTQENQSDNSSATSAGEEIANISSGDQTPGAAPDKPAKNPPRRRAKRSRKSPGAAKTSAVDSSGAQTAPASADANASPESGQKPEQKSEPQAPTAPAETPASAATPAPAPAEDSTVNTESAAITKSAVAAQPVENQAAQPATPASQLPQEGIIVSTSSSESEGATKPKRKGWWSRG